MGVNILEKVSFTKPRILDITQKLFHPAIPEVFSRKRECQSNNIDMAKINIEISTPNRNPLDILDISTRGHFECDILGPVKESLDQNRLRVYSKSLSTDVMEDISEGSETFQA